MCAASDLEAGDLRRVCELGAHRANEREYGRVGRGEDGEGPVELVWYIRRERPQEEANRAEEQEHAQQERLRAVQQP